MMCAMLSGLLSSDSDFLEIQEFGARNMVIVFGRLNGMLVVLYVTQPLFLPEFWMEILR
jgi:acetyl-CoA carboxylase carboxyltransferase component